MKGQVLYPDVYEFTDTQTSCIKKGQHNIIAQTARRFNIRLSHEQLYPVRFHIGYFFLRCFFYRNPEDALVFIQMLWKFVHKKPYKAVDGSLPLVSCRYTILPLLLKPFQEQQNVLIGQVRYPYPVCGYLEFFLHVCQVEYE